MEPFNILEDDMYSEVIDLEQGHTAIVLDTQTPPVSLRDIYETHDVFNAKLQTELALIQENMKKDVFPTDSPLTMSICSTEDDKKRKKVKRYTYEEVALSLEKQQDAEIHLTSELQLLLTYVKGQKHIFSQANRITRQKFNFLMFPAIFITASITVIGPFFQQISWSGWILSALNALLTCLIAMNNFMKFQASAELFLNISNQFDKLGISVEMSKNQYIFVEDKQKRFELLLDKRKETEKRIMDIQYNYNNLVIPYEIQLLNPVISHTNIYSFLQKIEQYKKQMILKYKDLKNDILFCMDSKNKPNEEKLQSLLTLKEQLKTELMQTNSHHVYSYIDNLFIREMQYSEHYYAYHAVGMYYCCFVPEKERFEYGNPIVDQYLNFIFSKPE